MQQLTPQQAQDVRKNVQSLMDSRENSVKVPTTKGNFQNTPAGWINTTPGGWKANPRYQNFSVFSVKWAPAKTVFAAQGETQAGIYNKQHLYIYLGVDRLESRNFPEGGWKTDGVNNAFKVAGLTIDHVFFASTEWAQGGKVLEVKPAMFEANWRMRGTAPDADGFFADPSEAPARYTGWVETPWTKYDQYPMTATFWRTSDKYSTGPLKPGVSLILYRGDIDALRYIAQQFPVASKTAYDPGGTTLAQLAQIQIFASDPVINPTTVFDEIPVPANLSAVDGYGISQVRVGGLDVEASQMFPPHLALRDHTWTRGTMAYTVPAFTLPMANLDLREIGGYSYVFSPNMRWRGQNVAVKCRALTDAQTLLIETNRFDWGAAQDEALFGVRADEKSDPELRVYLNGIRSQSQAGAFTAGLSVHARVLYEKSTGVHIFQFWNTIDPVGDPTQEPQTPSGCVPASLWFHWCDLTQYFTSESFLKLIPRDSVSGRLDSTDVMPDSWYALEGAQGKFLSLGHTSTISALDGDHPHELSSDLNVLELYKFNDLEYKKDTLDEDDQYVIRHPDGNGGAVLQYGPLSALQANVDTRMPLSVDQNSIDYAELSGDSYLQLYKFPDRQRLDVSKALSDETDAVLRHRYLSAPGKWVVEVDYLSAGEVVNPVPDAAAAYQGYGRGAFRSLDEGGKDAATGKAVWELYKFRDRTYWTHLSDLVEGCASFAVRQEAGGTQVNYVPADELKVLTDSEGNASKSVERYGTYGTELRLYDFMGCAETYSSLTAEPTFKDFAADGYSVLARQDDDGVGPKLKYFNLKYLSRYADDDIVGMGQSSLETRSDANSLDSPYFQLYDFQTPTVTPFNFTLKYDDKAYHLTNGLSTSEDVQLVVRNAEGLGKEVQYYDFTITAPKVGKTDLTQEVINELTSSHCDCGEKWVWISAVVQDLSSQMSSLTGDYWESGGDSSTCYGSQIGDSTKTPVIDLDSRELAGSWTANTLEIDTYFKVAGTVDFYPGGCAYFTATPYFQNGVAMAGALQIGSTSLNEQELIRLKQLLQ